MYQSFIDLSDPTLGLPRTQALRKEMKKRGLDYFLLPRTDEYQGEYVAAYAERLAWLTGFTGSAGFAIITPRAAVLFVDGRYTIQAADQVDGKTFDILNVPKTSPLAWLKKNVKKGQTIGFDENLITIHIAGQIDKIVKDLGANSAPQTTNPIDAVWQGQPKRPAAQAHPHLIKYAGQKAVQKIDGIKAQLKEAGQDATILSDPLSVAWALNIRGADIPHTPVVLATAIIHLKGKPDLFINFEKLNPALEKHLKSVAHIRHEKDMTGALNELSKRRANVRLDPQNCPYSICRVLEKKGAKISAKISHGADPCIHPRAIKNKTEITGSRSAHLRDGVAIVKFLAWLDASVLKSKVTEIDAAKTLEEFRAESRALKELSFDTISGAGPNGAIVHYRVTETTNRRLKSGELFLVDSGAQYLDGTTDITRTVCIGKPTREMRDRFTRVLKGHIALAMARFPIGTRGVDIDILARQYLWAQGFDYDHGTGHGVGSYLAVHEGPQNISKRGMTALEPGMIISNEPGYYKEGGYGIRIENLVLVNEAELVKGGERKMLSFETLTLAPIDQRLIDQSLLIKDELNWLNDYHARVQKALAPELKGDNLKWLKAATAPIS